MPKRSRFEAIPVNSRWHSVRGRRRLMRLGGQIGFDFNRPEQNMQVLRTFGLWDFEDTTFFFEQTGRLNAVIRAWRVALARRRQAVLDALRNILPTNVTLMITNHMP